MRDIPQFDLAASRWPLNAVLVWVATRDEGQTSTLGLDTVHGSGLHMSISESLGGARQRRPLEAWPELAESMLNGEIKAIATRTYVSRLKSTEQSYPGQLFPPDHSPGRALAYVPFSGVVIGGLEQTVLRPEAWLLAAEYEEWRDILFPRVDVIRLWPPRPIDGPPEKPKQRYDELAARKLIEGEMQARGGFISQDEGARLLTDQFTIKREEAREFVKKVTGNTTRGRPKGPRTP